MNTYLIAVYDGETPYIESITARNLNDAKDRFIQKYTFEDDDIIIFMNTDSKPVVIKSATDESLIQLILPIKTY